MSSAYTQPVINPAYTRLVKGLQPVQAGVWQPRPTLWQPMKSARQPIRVEGEASEGLEPPVHGRRKVTTAGIGLAASIEAARLTTREAKAERIESWRVIDLPLEAEAKEIILYDIEFDPADQKRGYVVGNKGTFLGTNNGGKTWEAESIGGLSKDEQQGYRFTECSLKDGEGFVIGRPPSLFYKKDAAAGWKQVPLSLKLPGNPESIVALGGQKVEMTTDTGAIYKSENAGKTWKALVKEPISDTLNRVSSSGIQGASYYTGNIISIQRATDGTRLAVSSRGNFYVTWRPGDDSWLPHNRLVRRRIMSMGLKTNNFDDGFWMTTAGGDLWNTAKLDPEELPIDIPFEELKLNSGGRSIIDVNFLPDGKNVWAVGGSGIILHSSDGGKNFQRERADRDLPANLYKTKFFGKVGYGLGSNGVLIKYG